ncbi:MAG TPA: hypothetical protein VMX54_10200 [Vicinamibacteria bacterium]|nr:hypothetical protein [Vicinamibacteria bacterium]
MKRTLSACRAFALALSVLNPALAASALAASALAAAPPSAPARTDAAGGIEWKVPAGWTAGGGSAMRVATYTVPAAKGSEPGECAVFFFGAGQGGSVEANVERWSRQFEGTPKPERTSTTAAGLPVTRVQLAGTYLAPGGPMMQSTGKRAGYRLLGTIVEAPQGNVFFKLTGPGATVTAALPTFDALITSIRKK